MSITQDGWYDWCDRVPGPADKVYSEPNAAMMYIPHSAVGYYGGWASRLFSTERDEQGRYTPYAAASVHLWFPQYRSEIPKQHYPIWASCWASGSRFPNTQGVAAENEGGFNPFDEPLTGWQVECNIRAIRELAALKGWRPRRPTSVDDLTATLYEHSECIRWGSAPTACPSNRIPWARIIADLEENAMTPAERARLEAVEATLAVNGITLDFRLADSVRALETQVGVMIAALERALAEIRQAWT